MNAGLYGKLPSHGDFLRRRVSDAFVSAWDDWLQSSLAASRQELGERWLELYLTSPAWRFACAPGTLVHGLITGVMVPSVDRVGRYFPLTLVAELPPEAASHLSPLTLSTQCEPWFRLIEDLAIEALATERLDFEVFDAHVAASSTTLQPLLGAPPVLLSQTDAASLMADTRGSWHVPLASAETMAPVIEQLAYARIRSEDEPLTLWWTDGSVLVDPCCLLVRGLPQPMGFASFLDGDWSRGGRWQRVQADVTAPADSRATVVEEAAPPVYVSAGRSERGPVRELNQDALLERSEAGIWVVADGMGGHEQGEVASRMVCDALAELVPEAALADLSASVQRRLQEVNAHLYRIATRAVAPLRTGTTVVVLLTRGSACEVLWAGDSRAYRLRGSRLERLTKDHVWSGAESGETPRESFEVTRAVGGEETLELDVYQGRVRVGDRLLLCSDGLTRVLSDAEIARHLGSADCAAAVSALMEAALAAGAPDNVTAVVVSASRGSDASLEVVGAVLDPLEDRSQITG